MREEYIKDSKTIDGVRVSNLGDEYVFSLKNKRGEDIEYHLTKPHKNEEDLLEYIKSKREELNNEE